jgi:hypothetical protein
MWIFLTEAVVVLAAIALVHAVPQLGQYRLIARANQVFRRLARNKPLSVWVVFTLSIFLRLLILPVVPVPEPQNHDEFSYLLAADTFASGRLANATHPLWRHFETFHIEHEPTYMSMYPPAQGLVLAAAQKVTGSPWPAVLLTTAGMCAAITWMLQAWLPSYWALIGGLLAIMRLGLFSYWVNSYWGGALPALAGAVFIGSLTRLCQRPSAVQASLAALSVAVLVNTRMYEGAVLVAATLISFSLFGCLRRIEARLRVVGPVILIGTATATAMLYYNRTVYGSALILPYSINRSTYAPAQIFLWQKPRPVPEYRHAAMRHLFAGVELAQFENFRTPAGFAVESSFKAVLFYVFFLGPLFTIPFVCIRLRDRRVRPITAIALMLMPAILVSAWFSPHYVSPATAVIYVLLLQSIRRLSTFTVRGKRVGTSCISLMFVAASALMSMIVLIIGCGQPSQHAPPLSWCGWMFRGSHRSAIVDRLSTQAGAHLVLVRSAGLKRDYVYNRAHIDGATIVWAREMSHSSNQELFTYFRNRRRWLLEADLTPMKLTELK